jgi:hypothetical protein
MPQEVSASPTSAQYVTLQIKSDDEKSKHASLVQQNSFSPAFFAPFAEAGKRHNKAW